MIFFFPPIGGPFSYSLPFLTRFPAQRLLPFVIKTKQSALAYPTLSVLVLYLHVGTINSGMSCCLATSKLMAQIVHGRTVDSHSCCVLRQQTTLVPLQEISFVLTWSLSLSLWLTLNPCFRLRAFLRCAWSVLKSKNVFRSVPHLFLPLKQTEVYKWPQAKLCSRSSHTNLRLVRANWALPF